MSFPEKGFFDKIFVRRTISNLNDYIGKYEFSMLMNSLLGLIIIPNEIFKNNKNMYKYKPLNMNLSKFKLLSHVFEDKKFTILVNRKEIYVDKFMWLSGKKIPINIENVKLGDFIKRIRNSVAHFGFSQLMDGDEWIGIIIENRTNNKDEEEYINFKCYLSKEDVNILSREIAKIYLSEK